MSEDQVFTGLSKPEGAIDFARRQVLGELEECPAREAAIAALDSALRFVEMAREREAAIAALDSALRFVEMAREKKGEPT